MGISTNIRNLREEHGWTQEQLANRLEVARSTVTQWEMGWTKPRMGMVEKLASIFHVTPADMVADEVRYYAMTVDALTTEEQRLIELFRKMDTRARHDLLTIAASLSPSESHTVGKEGAA